MQKSVFMRHTYLTEPFCTSIYGQLVLLVKKDRRSPNSGITIMMMMMMIMIMMMMIAKTIGPKDIMRFM